MAQPTPVVFSPQELKLIKDTINSVVTTVEDAQKFSVILQKLKQGIAQGGMV
jgi:hypothetical protein